MTRSARLTLLVLVLLACIGCDQGTKRLARTHLRSSPTTSYLSDSVRLTYAENPGAFLSLGAQLPDSARQGLFTWGVGALLLALAVFALRKRQVGRAELVAYALMLGGGLSNWGDRVLRGGAVVDFLNLGVGPLRTGIFNVADVAIVLGVALLVLPGTLRASRGDTA